DDIDGGGEYVARGFLPSRHRQHEIGTNHCRDQHQCRRRQQPLGALGVEADQRHGTGALDLLEQQAGDQEAGDHEENIDTCESTRHVAQLQVVEQHHDDGNRTQPFDIGPERGRGSVVLHYWSPPAACATARNSALPLFNVSSHSITGSESWTMPAPACTCSLPPWMTAVRMAMAMSASPHQLR